MAGNPNRNVGADASSRQKWDAISTSIGARGKLSTVRKQSRAFSTSGPKASTEGLDSAKSTWLKMNGNGYPTQHVRGPKVPTDLRSLKPGSFSARKNHVGPMVDYTMGKSGTNSIARMHSMTKLNRMF
jgi:hypothetical protein